jgi:hypothetical protein
MPRTHSDGSGQESQGSGLARMSPRIVLLLAPMPRWAARRVWLDRLVLSQPVAALSGGARLTARLQAGEGRELLGEDAPRTLWCPADKATDAEAQGQRRAVPGQIVQRPAVGALDAMRTASTEGTHGTRRTVARGRELHGEAAYIRRLRHEGLHVKVTAAGQERGQARYEEERILNSWNQGTRSNSKPRSPARSCRPLHSARMWKTRCH